MRTQVLTALSLVATLTLLVPGAMVTGSLFAFDHRDDQFRMHTTTSGALLEEEEASSIVFSDDFATDPNTNSRWTVHRYAGDLSNEASWDSDHGVLYLTRAVGPRASAIFANYQLDSTWWEASFRYKAGGGSGADGLAFMFYKDAQAYGAPNAGGTLGFLIRETGWDPVPGYGIEFDNYYNTSDPSSNHIAIIEDTPRNHLISVNDSRTEDNAWHDVVVSFDNGHLEVFLDGDTVLNYTLVDPDYTYTGVGFAAATWSYNNNHIIDDFVLRTIGEADFSVSGHVYDGSGNPISGVTLFDDVGHTAITDSNGSYTLGGFLAGIHTFTPFKSGYIFSPSSRTVRVPPDLTEQDFIGNSPTLALEFPWTSGVGWHFTGGPHPSLGSPVWDALDFMPCDEDRTVRAAADGVVAKADLSANKGNLYIDHENGWTTFYGHLEAITVTQGMTVAAGQPVAIAGDRGADSMHLHFGLRYNGDWTPIGNGDISLGGWRAYSGTISYTGHLEQDGVEIVAGGGCYHTDNIVSTYFAQDVGAAYPLAVSPGEVFSPTIRVANTGHITWTQEDQVRLGLLTWNDKMGADLRQSLDPGESVAPGEVRTWTIPMTAPSQPGTYWQEWRMVRGDGKIGWFGESIRLETHVATETVESIISPSGGSLTSQDGNTTLIFPPDSVADYVVVTYRSLLPMPTGHMPGIGHFFDLTAVYSDTRQTAHLVPDANYTMTIAYASSDSVTEDTLALHCWDGSQWVREPTSEVDVDANTIIARPSHFSLWAVLGEAQRVFLPVVLRN